MKTNVIFKNGVNLVCDKVDKGSTLSFLYFNKVCPCKATELMNECMKNNWNFDQRKDDGLLISVGNEQIERFEALLF